MTTHRYVHICQSIKGLHKKHNEDNFLTIDDERFNLYAIFDGVGSALNSKKATDLAKEFIIANYTKYFSSQIKLDELMYDCNNYIINSRVKEPFTTYCVIVLFKSSPNEATYSYMGDSRIYLISKRFIEQITTDDKVHLSNVVTKCLGMNTLGNYDFYQKSINITDENLLLCTDGFYCFLEEDRMKFFEIFNKKNLKSVQEEIISIVSNRNKDDATFVLIR
ncbi:PP2C family serine/threonine-protein phosphatase [Mucilaginibacter sp. AK015]|uniref:PP2C family protein-serine/threonine phosphatase n=1 Tax=Mucilaginibacter sp. AK015 TaxID=2723072 RepID=UPI00161F42A3|nr:protein phosphatase 2C domain-containing protein [Mucilaginibacter sp. AK015]MBB5397943.1 serine/threonine protein phosphatase PrpC [Mucilaginibacter sp. AK015]